MSRGSPRLILSCEHASRRVPARWRDALAGARRALDTHRGWDPGALELARVLARALGAPLAVGRASRLVVDLNRSLGHPRLFSPWTRRLPGEEREAILDALWHPYRREVARLLEAGFRGGHPVVHLSLHSFTPVLDGRRRDVDLGLLFDPGRPGERRLARAWKPVLQEALAGLAAGRRSGGLRVRLNAPYRGTSDGLTRDLRLRHPDGAYAGLELEVSQRLPAAGGAAWRGVQRAVLESFRQAVAAAWPHGLAP